MGRLRTIDDAQNVGFKASAGDRQVLHNLMQKTGLSKTDVIRALLRSADAQPVTLWMPVVRQASAEGVTL